MDSPPITPRPEQLGRFRAFAARLRLPVIVAPMFLISGPEMVIAAARAGVVGAFPAPNARTIADLHAWCATIAEATAGLTGWALNLLTHSTYARFDEELTAVRQHRPPLVITALGSPARVLETVHEYGGLVFADVSTPTHARRALEAGADGLILLSAGAGGHTGRYNPFALVAELRRIWSGPLVLSGCIADGRAILAAQVMGADLAYMGTRFLAARESLGEEARKRMTLAATLEDVVTSAAITGVPANWLLPSLKEAGFPLDTLDERRRVDFSNPEAAKPWKNIWGAGQGVGAVRAIEGVEAIVAGLGAEYAAAQERWRPTSHSS